MNVIEASVRHARVQFSPLGLTSISIPVDAARVAAHDVSCATAKASKWTRADRIHGRSGIGPAVRALVMFVAGDRYRLYACVACRTSTLTTAVRFIMVNFRVKRSRSTCSERHDPMRAALVVATTLVAVHARFLPSGSRSKSHP